MGLSGQGGLRLGDQCLKRFRLTHRMIGENLSGEFDAGFFHAIHELEFF